MAVSGHVPVVIVPPSLTSLVSPSQGWPLAEKGAHSSAAAPPIRVCCVYSVEQFVSVEKPLAHASEIPFGIASIATVLKQAGHKVSLLVLTPETPLKEILERHILQHRPTLFCFTAV